MMDEHSENIVVRKPYAFSLEIIRVYKILIERKEYILSKQILKNGVSIGANIHEAISGHSKKDFIHKFGIAVMEARETSYWLNLLRDGGFISEIEFDKLNIECSEIIRIINSIILATRERYFPNS